MAVSPEQTTVAYSLETPAAFEPSCAFLAHRRETRREEAVEEPVATERASTIRRMKLPHNEGIVFQQKEEISKRQKNLVECVTMSVNSCVQFNHSPGLQVSNQDAFKKTGHFHSVSVSNLKGRFISRQNGDAQHKFRGQIGTVA
ncbi:hypothetical protein X797_004578 [Metarhizium robertsii]|uniref:Uncharacterized protein n=1 Tax=Metarhizium robertsii TaxID=568076 RepID=A0A0A1UYN5_9HYPO|nr:hypothetical protein X797_004578 [Metarhizium robertsii]